MTRKYLYIIKSFFLFSISSTCSFFLCHVEPTYNLSDMKSERYYMFLTIMMWVIFALRLLVAVINY